MKSLKRESTKSQLYIFYLGGDFMSNNIDILHSAPSPEEYNVLRITDGLSRKNISGAKTALQNSTFVVTLRNMYPLNPLECIRNISFAPWLSDV